MSSSYDPSSERGYAYPRRSLGPTPFLLLGALIVWVGYLTWDRFRWSSPMKVEPREVAPRGDLAEFEKTTMAIYEGARESVVSVRTTARAWNYTEVEAGQGSGFVWDDHGHIVTNFHVVVDAIRNKWQLAVTFADGTSVRASVIDYAAQYDLAVLHVSNGRTKPLRIGTSGDLRVGQSVFAIGNPFGFDQTLTVGVVSAIGRQIASLARTPIQGVIQTDAAINPGNSGGPLLDSAGRLIGVNTAIARTSAEQSAGIGFAIPVDTVNQVVPQLISGEKARVARPLLGVNMAPDQTNVRLGGVMIVSVVEGSPADRAGLRGRSETGEWGDKIVEIDGSVVRRQADLTAVLIKHKVGDEATLKIEREGRSMQVKVKLDVAAD